MAGNRLKSPRINSLGKIPSASVPGACGGWGETQAAYRFFDNEKVTFFRILKSGCEVQRLQLESIERLEPALALYMFIAWRIQYLTMLGRS